MMCTSRLFLAAILASAWLLMVGLPSASAQQPPNPTAGASAPKSPSAPQVAPGSSPVSPSAAGTPTQDLPPGHPPIDSTSGANQAAWSPLSPGLAVRDDPSLEPGRVFITVRDGSGKPVPNLELTLQILDPASPNPHRAANKGRTDSDGSSGFDGLSPGSDVEYQVTAVYESVEYRSPWIRMTATAGKRISLPVFDVTSNVDEPPVGLQVIVQIEPSDGYLQVEELLQFFNVGTKTWRPHSLVVPLPQGASAFQSNDEQSEVHLDWVRGQGYRLSGVVRPGRSEVSFRYQVPYADPDSARLTLHMPPRVARLRIISPAIRDCRLQVDGMPDAVAMTASGGQRLLVTERTVAVGDSEIETAAVSILNLPARSMARWYALAIAAGFVSVGLYFAARKNFGNQKSGVPFVAGIQQSKLALLQQWAALHRAHASGEVGPRTYKEQRRIMIDSLAELLAIERSFPGDS